MKRLAIAFVCAGVLEAQSLTITSPSSNQNISGYAGLSFAVTLNAAPSVVRVCYAVDGYPATNPGDVYTWGTNLGGLAYTGCSITPPFSLPWNSFWTLNGPKQVVATGYDTLGNPVATSAPVSFSVGNTFPCSWNPSLSVSTNTPITSSWSGQIAVSATLSGSHATDTSTFAFYLDGIVQATATINSGSASASIDTTQFPNGQHFIAVTVSNNGSSCTAYNDGNYLGGAGEWSRAVTFANGATPMEVRNDAHDIFMTPGSTHTLTPTLISTDGTMVSSPTFYYLTQSANNSNNCTLSVTTGSSTIVTAASNTGSCEGYTMSPTQTATDGATYSTVVGSLTSSQVTFRTSAVGQMVYVSSGGTNCPPPGGYMIGAISTNANFILLAGFSGNSASGCKIALGPTRAWWALVNPTNPMPCFGKDGAIHSSYTPACFFMNESFNSGDGFTDQPYNVPGCASQLGFACDQLMGGFNTIEFGITNQDVSGSAGQSGFTSGQSAYMTQIAQTIAGCLPKCTVFFTGDNLTRNPQSLFYLTRGAGSPLGNWTSTAVQIVFQSVKNASSSFTSVGQSWMDEINNWGQNPMQGPTRPGAGTIQNWLTSITASNGTCTALTTNTTPGGAYSMFGGQFVISGSGTPYMNSTRGNMYTKVPVDSTHFSFSCPNVPNGTYNSANDPNLTIETLSAGGWWGSDYLHHDAWANLLRQANSIAGRVPVAGSQAAQTNLTAVACWEGGPCGQSMTVAGTTVHNLSDWADIYWSHGTFENYLTRRSNPNALITDNVSAGSGGPEEGFWLRTLYGAGHDPSKPLTTITQGTSANYGLTGQVVKLSSTSGSLFNFTSPHGVTTVYPGVTRMQCSGTSASEYNAQFYVIDVPSPTTMHATLAATDFTGTISAGTATLQNGDTLSVSSLTATGAVHPFGEAFTYRDSPNSHVNRDRGQTVTFTGTGNSSFNSRTFFFTPENLALATDANGTPSSTIYIRELPAGTSTGGSCTVLADNNFIKGRNGDLTEIGSVGAGHFASPQLTSMSIFEAAAVGAAGHRFYKSGDTMQGYVDHVIGSPSNWPWIKGGWTGLFSGWLVTTFPQSAVQMQLFSLPRFENGFAAPMWHTASVLSLMLTRWQKYLLQPRLNSPDYGFTMDCSARSGAPGNLLMCGNFSEGPESRNFALSAYWQSGQQIIREVVSNNTGAATIVVLAAGTVSDTLTLQPEDIVFYVFPARFGTELVQPVISASLADVPNAASIAVRFGYDPYLFDAGISNSVNCGTGTCTLPVDRNIGTVYYRIVYLDSNSRVLASSDVQTL